MARTSLTHWRGKTIYRKCTCGETAFGAVHVVGEGTISQWLYRCRNCNLVHLFRLPKVRL